MSVPRFHSLTVREVRAETTDSISVSLAVPPSLHADYRFIQGQFLTLKANVSGEELRRSYSICVSTDDYENDRQLRVGIKRVADGKFSNWANDHLRVGQSIDVMTPDGRFHRPLDAAQEKHYLGVAGGSGITPMLSIIATTLAKELHSQFTLIYGNRNSASVMFLDELDHLKSRYLARLQIVHVLSEEPQEVDLFHGVLDASRCQQIIAGLQLLPRVSHAFICGPEPMMAAAEKTLLTMGLPAAALSIERFGSPSLGATSAAPSTPTKPQVLDDKIPRAEVWLSVDGKTRVLKVPFEGQAILDAGLASGAILPYACKGGVCCTCRAKVIEGEVRMDKNFTLEPDEIAQGFVLTCQAHPITPVVKISFDER